LLVIAALVAVAIPASAQEAASGDLQTEIPLSPQAARVLEQKLPKSVDDLKAIESQVRQVVERVLPATVNIRIGSSQGSGVIVGQEGYVLTAGHVAMKAGLDVILTLPSGKRVKGKTLGINHALDSGMIKISEKGDWPHVELAEADTLAPGDWCVSTGHPGGYQRERTPVVRLGRVLFVNDRVICTDCTLVGGDSGGPLFDMQGRVVGIHSRIGWHTTTNFHVPISTYHSTWDRLAAGEVWGGSRNRLPASIRPFVGVAGPPDGERCVINEVFPGSPAARTGIQVGDVIRSFGGKKVQNFAELAKLVVGKRPGEKVTIELERNDKTVDVELTLGARRGWMPGGPSENESK